jgi:hypothetical protein
MRGVFLLVLSLLKSHNCGEGREPPLLHILFCTTRAKPQLAHYKIILNGARHVSHVCHVMRIICLDTSTTILLCCICETGKVPNSQLGALVMY